MEPHDYFDNDYDNINENSVDEIRKECYKEFMQTLNSVIDVVSVFPPEWQLQMLKGIMDDI